MTHLRLRLLPFLTHPVRHTRRASRRCAQQPCTGAVWAADRGSAALGAAIFTPVFIALLALVIAAGRIQIAQGAADAAARDAARTASLSDSPDTAQGEARQAAADSLRRSGLACSDIAVAVESEGIDSPVGQAATVTATVSCTVPLDDVALPALPGTKTLTSSMTSVVDQWRAR